MFIQLTIFLAIISLSLSAPTTGNDAAATTSAKHSDVHKTAAQTPQAAKTDEAPKAHNAAETPKAAAKDSVKRGIFVETEDNMRYEYLGEYDVHKNTALGEIAVHFEKQIREKLKHELTATSPIKGEVKARLYAHSKKGGKTVLDRKETILDSDHKLYEKVKDEDLLIIFAPMFQTSFNMILEPVDGEWSDSD